MAPNELLRTARVTLNLTQAELARELGVSSQTVSNWETGRQRPQPRQIRELLKALGVNNPETLGFAPTAQRRPRGTVGPGRSGQKGPTVLGRRELLTVLSAAMGGAMAAPIARMFPSTSASVRVGASDVAEVNLLAKRTYDIERLMGGGVIRPEPLVRQFHRVLNLLHGTFAESSTKQEMHEAVTRYGTYAAWSLVDQGEHATAQHVFAATLAATEGIGAGHRDVRRANLMGDLARQAIYRGDYRTAIAVLDYLEISTALPADVRAIMRARRARALGGIGDFRSVIEISRNAEDEFESSGQGSQFEYASTGFGRGELHSDLGHAFSSLTVLHGHKGDEAMHRLTASIASYGPGETRSRAFAGAELINVCIADGDASRAYDFAEQYADQIQTVQSARLDNYINTGRMLAKKQSDAGMADVIDILSRMRTTA